VQQEDRRATGTCNVTSDSRDARAAGGNWIQLHDDALVLSQQRTFYAYSAIANATVSVWNDLWLLTVLAVTSMRRRGGRSLGDSIQQPRRVATVPSYPHQNHQIKSRMSHPRRDRPAEWSTHAQATAGPERTETNPLCAMPQFL
jgi:hypothetical protein